MYVCFRSNLKKEEQYPALSHMLGEFRGLEEIRKWELFWISLKFRRACVCLLNKLA